MRRRIVFLLCVLLLLGFDSPEQSWNRLTSIYWFNTISFGKNQYELILSSNNFLYKYDIHKNNLSLLTILSASTKIKCIYTYDDYMYLATSNGAFQFNVNDKKLLNILKSSDSAVNDVRAIYREGENILIGTKSGLFLKRFAESNAIKLKLPISDDGINLIESSENNYIVSTAATIYAINKNNYYVEVVLDFANNEIDVESDELLPDVTSKSTNIVKEIQFDAVNKKFYVLTIFGIYSFDSNLEQINKINLNQFSFKKATSVRHLNDRLFDEFIVSTNRGAFFISENTVNPLVNGLASNCINKMISSQKNDIYAATSDGLYFLNINKTYPIENQYKDSAAIIIDIDELINGNPSIGQVHQMVIKYADVHPDKIRKWKSQAKNKAFLPRLSLDFDKDINRTSSDSIWGSYTSGGQHYVGPRDNTDYRNNGINISLSWELSDLIFNDDQTSIDSRSKMLVELRGELLDSVTRIYFERIRVEYEILNNQFENESDLLNKRIRLQELTAYIDAVTGGEFTKLVQLKNPQLVNQ